MQGSHPVTIRSETCPSRLRNKGQSASVNSALEKQTMMTQIVRKRALCRRIWQSAIATFRWGFRGVVIPRSHKLLE